MISRVLCIVAFLFLVSTPETSSAPSCAQVLNSLMPCLSYLQSQDPTPTCCAGVKTLKTLATTKADREAICDCGKQALGPLTYDPKLLTALPSKCGVDLNIPPIDKNYDCSKFGQMEGTME